MSQRSSITHPKANYRLFTQGSAGAKREDQALGPHPHYLRVKNFIIDHIRSGQWGAETRIPSEKELGEHFHISRMTVNRAIRELMAEGFVTRLQGVGTFVARRKPQGALLEIKSIADEIAEGGGRHTSRVLLLAQETASSELAREMGLIEGAGVFHSIIVHIDNGLPVQLSNRYVNPAVAPEFLQQDFTTMTPSEYLLRVAPLEEAEQVVEAAMPDAFTRKALKIRAGEPCLVLYRRTWSFGKVATRSRLIYPGSRFRLGGRFNASFSVHPTLA
ncbi:MAG: histidine utilization repressor [Deltaproteobacteria bacterium]|nr:histidine utilization repressor [Deltaproteobacteria bacterium]